MGGKMTRDEKVKSMRPELDLGHSDKKELELFQNETLRPILKLQHEVTLLLLQNHRYFKTDHLANATRLEYENFVTQYVQSNVDLRNQLLGTLIGMFTKNELAFYFTERKELNKRMIQMQLKRFVDTLHASIVN